MLTIVSAYSGIHFVNKIIEKSGKQSIIAVILTFVLIFALGSLPIDYFLKMQKAAAVEHAEGGDVAESVGHLNINAYPKW